MASGTEVPAARRRAGEERKLMTFLPTVIQLCDWMFSGV